MKTNILLFPETVVLFRVATPRSPLSLSLLTETVRMGLDFRTPFEIRRTLPVLFSRTKMFLLSINAILVGDDRPCVTVSTFRLLSETLGAQSAT